MCEGSSRHEMQSRMHLLYRRKVVTTFWWQLQGKIPRSAVGRESLLLQATIPNREGERHSTNREPLQQITYVSDSRRSVPQILNLAPSVLAKLIGKWTDNLVAPLTCIGVGHGAC